MASAKALPPMRNPAHPGGILEDGWLADGMTAAAAAEQLGVPAGELQKVLDERRGVTPALALRLEAAGWGSAPLWMRLQAAYDLAQERLLQERRQAA